MEKLTANCIQCDEPFEISSQEQERYERMGFDLPRRCPQCRKHKSRQQEDFDRKKGRDKKKHYRMKYTD